MQPKPGGAAFFLKLFFGSSYRLGVISRKLSQCFRLNRGCSFRRDAVGTIEVRRLDQSGATEGLSP